MSETPLPSPSVYPTGAGLPVILSVPHSGRDLPESVARAAIGGSKPILGLADPLVDLLVAPLVERGIGAVIARAPRGAIDPNRATDALEPNAVKGAAPPPPRSREAKGLGLIPSRGPGGSPLWREPLPRVIAQSRIAAAWLPYHDAVERLIDQVAARHGGAILLDCHSMPPRRRGLPPVVIGDRHGTSCAGWVSAAAAYAVRACHYQSAFNHPFAGGEIVRRHGDPDRNIHALQIEVDRSLYLDRYLRDAGPGWRRTQMLYSAIVDALLAEWDRHGLRAAE
ncbi:N-formylglutamate amidohydrolase [Sphingomicrobium marinum]|uniref:N-formylglutamate amidohydrolase n=1 Tax=Sphingomicrobium marinum TaxID=1227950 RepID=UPI0022408581|nr:N-formylglutamate amidohydrolase [Sphingomicrobium marinum]